MINITDDDIIVIPIAKNGVETGESLTFDTQDIDLPFKYQEMLEKHKKNTETLRNKLLVIEKKQDVPSKKLLSAKEEERIKATKEFFEKEIEVYNIFLGENGVQKLLCGRKLGWFTLNKIDKIIERDILPHLDMSFNSVIDKIKNKYSDNKDKNVI